MSGSILPRDVSNRRTIRHVRKIASASVDIDSTGVRSCQFEIDDRGTHTPHPSCEKPHVPVYALQRRCEGVASESSRSLRPLDILREHTAENLQNKSSPLPRRGSSDDHRNRLMLNEVKTWRPHLQRALSMNTPNDLELLLVATRRYTPRLGQLYTCQVPDGNL